MHDVHEVAAADHEEFPSHCRIYCLALIKLIFQIAYEAHLDKLMFRAFKR